MKGGILILAIDLELSGCHLDKDNIVAIGWAGLAATTGEVLAQGCISLEPIPGRRSFEQRCYEQFWRKNMSLLKELTAGEVSPGVGTASFFAVLDELDRDYEVRIVSDNPSCDIAWLDLYASIFLDRKPICYKNNDDRGWRPVYDTDSFARATAKIPYRTADTYNSEVMKALNIKPELIPPHTHHPMQDALSIATLHRLVYLKQYE
jgi:hypothetical protein